MQTQDPSIRTWCLSQLCSPGSIVARKPTRPAIGMADVPSIIANDANVRPVSMAL